jgi:hypothetical protein
VPIYVEVSLITVHALANVIRQPAHSENVSGTIERETIIKVEALAGDHLLVD